MTDKKILVSKTENSKTYLEKGYLDVPLEDAEIIEKASY